MIVPLAMFALLLGLSVDGSTPADSTQPTVKAARDAGMPLELNAWDVIRSGRGRLVLVRNETGKLRKVLALAPNNQTISSCPQYMALLEHHYLCPNLCSGTCPQCGGDPSAPLGGPGVGFSDEASEACDIAHSEECSQLEYGCAYQYCEHITNWLGIYVGEAGGGCLYEFSGYCSVGSCQ